MEQSGPSYEERPKVRVVKGGKGRPRSGVITVRGENGEVFYRCSCDRCDGVATTRERPMAAREVVCGECAPMANKMKPSTKIKRRSGKPLYITDCDECGVSTKTFFMPRKSRPLLCKDCIEEAEDIAQLDREEAEKEAAEEARRAAEAKKIAEAEAAVATDENSTERAGIYEAPSLRKPKKPDSFQQVIQEKIRNKKKAEEKYEFPCRRCDKILELSFLPKPGEDIICPACYKERNEREARKNPTGTRIFYNIECARCGRKEALHFVPRLGSDAVCSKCFNSKRR